MRVKKASFGWSILIIVMGSSTNYLAQDIHFSQIEYTPLQLNPAMVGLSSPLQAIVNYRSQWNSVADPYTTISASVDGRLNEGKLRRNGILAGGIQLYSDKAGDTKVVTNTATVQLGYHIRLDRTSTLGFALYGGFGQRSIVASNGRWASQYNGAAFDATSGSGELLNNPSFAFVDVGAGFVYAYRGPKENDKEFTYGVATYHVNNPKYSFVDQTSEKLAMRWSAFINAHFTINNSRSSFLPGIYWQHQRQANEIMLGTYYRYRLSEGANITGFTSSSALSLGIFTRFKDALVAKFMLEWEQFSTGFSYDLNISSLTDVSRAKGGFEVFLRYNLSDRSLFRARL